MTRARRTRASVSIASVIATSTSRVSIASAIALVSVALASSPREARAGEDAPSSEAVRPSEPEPAAPPLPSRRRTPIGLRLDGGYSYRELLELPITGADIGLALGSQPSRHFGVWGTTRLFLGSTENGLDVYTARLGADFDIVLDRVRIDLGPNLFLVGIARAARDETILSWGPAAHAGLRLDFVRAEAFAMFVRADADAGWELYDGSLYWGATFGGGVDFDLAGSRAEPTARRGALTSRTGSAAARSP